MTLMHRSVKILKQMTYGYAKIVFLEIIDNDANVKTENGGIDEKFIILISIIEFSIVLINIFFFNRSRSSHMVPD